LVQLDSGCIKYVYREVWFRCFLGFRDCKHLNCASGSRNPNGTCSCSYKSQGANPIRFPQTSPSPLDMLLSDGSAGLKGSGEIMDGV